MSRRIWLGSIFLKDEGGYEIILTALNHYLKRIRSIGSTPELKDSGPTFIQILQQESMKTRPKIQDLIDRINEGLEDKDKLNKIQNDLPLIEKALNCYEVDIQRAIKEPKGYYSELLGDSYNWQIDLEKINTAKEKLNQFS